MFYSRVVPGIIFLTLSRSAYADPAPTFIQQADALYTERSDAAQDAKALELYEKALKETPDDTSLLWKAARSCWWAGTRSQARADQISFFEKGMVYGKKSVEKSPTIVESHFWLGSNYASFGHAKGAFTSLGLIKKIRLEMAETNKIDESYLYGGADRVLGILDYMVPGLMGGNRARALKLLQKALTYAPNHPVTRFYIADYYADGKEYSQARKELDALNQLKVPQDLEPEAKIIEPERAALTKKLAGHS